MKTLQNKFNQSLKEAKEIINTYEELYPTNIPQLFEVINALYHPNVINLNTPQEKAKMIHQIIK